MRDSDLPNLFPALDPRLYADLGRSVSDQEIKDSLFAIGPYKAPGPDGFSACFYQGCLCC